MYFLRYVGYNLNLTTYSYIGSDKAIADLPWGSGNVASGGVGKFRDLYSILTKGSR